MPSSSPMGQLSELRELTTTSTNTQNSLHHSIPTPTSTCQVAGLRRLTLVRELAKIPQSLFCRKPQQAHHRQTSSSEQQNESALESHRACPSERSHRLSKQEPRRSRKDFLEHHLVLLSQLPASNRLQFHPISPRLLICQVLKKSMKMCICTMQTKM